MVVRVKLRVSRGNRAKIVTVLVNSGAESEEPVVVLRPEDAVELGFSLRSDFDIIEVELASGKTQCFISRSKVKVELLDDSDNILSTTQAYLAVDEGLTEPLITDATIDELGITVISFKKGLWRHINDPPQIIRKSAPR
jgi:predicted aspartyl protease